jgi:hypothetical protein
MPGPHVPREDCIRSENEATDGDVRRICALFGLGVAGATANLGTVEHPDLTIEGQRIPRT